MTVRKAEGNVLLWKGAGRSSIGFFMLATAALTSFMAGKLPSSKNRSSISRAAFASSGALCQISLPKRMVLAWRHMALTHSSACMLEIPCSVCCTSCISPALTSKCCHCSASVSSSESSESSVFVAAVAANKFWINLKEVLETMWPLMYASQAAA